MFLFIPLVLDMLLHEAVASVYIFVNPRNRIICVIVNFYSSLLKNLVALIFFYLHNIYALIYGHVASLQIHHSPTSMQPPLASLLLL